MKDPGRRNFSAKRNANFRSRGAGKPDMVIGQPTGTPAASARDEAPFDEAPPTEAADLTAAGEPAPEAVAADAAFVPTVDALAGAHIIPGEEERYPDDFGAAPKLDRAETAERADSPFDPYSEHPGTPFAEYHDSAAYREDSSENNDRYRPVARRQDEDTVFEARGPVEPPEHPSAAGEDEFPPATRGLSGGGSHEYESPSHAPERTVPDEDPAPAAHREAQPDYGFAAPPTEYSSRRGARTQPPRFPIPPPPFFRNDPSPPPAEPEPLAPVDPAAAPAAEIPPPPAFPEPVADESSKALEVTSPGAAGDPAPAMVPHDGPRPTTAEPLADASSASVTDTLPAAPEPLTLLDDVPTPPGASAPSVPPPPTVVPAAFLPRHSPDYAPDTPRGASFATVALLSLLFLALGGAAGYFVPDLLKLRGNDGTRSAAGLSPESAGKETPASLAPAEQNDVDAAFTAVKAQKFTEAARLFSALQSKHPAWGSMAIEISRTQFYEHDLAGARATLEAAVSKGQQPADANLMLGLLYMADNTYADAESHFARATALDPARPDFYYFWGECLRRQGKPLDAISKFRSALIRNQYETSEGLYRLKLWLSEIQADQENASGTSAEIEAFLAQPRPPMEALFAGAARGIKAGQIAAAAELIRRARQFVEPSVYAVIMRDPSFAQENWRPEFAEFFKLAAPAASASTPAANPASTSAPLAPAVRR